jgi:hypothetical protein
MLINKSEISKGSRAGRPSFFGDFIPCTMNFSPNSKPLAFVKEEERPNKSEEDLLGQAIVNLFKP